MISFIKTLLLALAILCITYFGFIHNIVLLQTIIVIFYIFASIVSILALVFLYGDFQTAIKFRKNLIDKSRTYDYIISISIVPIVCWIYYTTQSYNLLSFYIILCIVSFIVRYKIKVIAIYKK